MKITGIIAEYNPLHKGHQYHLNAARKNTGADHLIVVMSGDFVQRGEPALFDKYARTRLALMAGADLVLELPHLYAAASAEYFATGAVSILNGLGCVDHLCFGTEEKDLSSLHKIADLLSHETPAFSRALSEALKKGLSYPAARMAALKQEFPDLDPSVLTSPNNILGIEYLKALLRSSSTISPLAIQRMGNGYHSTDTCGTFLSATAIRKALAEGNTDILSNIPDFECLTEEEQTPVFLSDLSLLYHTSLIMKTSYESCWEVSADLANRIKNILPMFRDPESFSSLLKTKNMAETRIRRALLHQLLDIRTETIPILTGIPPYARILGFRQSSTELLSVLKKNSTIPLISKPAKAYKQLTDAQQKLFDLDVKASAVYHAIRQEKTKESGYLEFTHSPIRI